MADYSKLKVNELKEALKARGIPLTGLKLKQNFIDKLVEADAAGRANTPGLVDAPTGVTETPEANERDSATKAQDVQAREKQAEDAHVTFMQPVLQEGIAKNENDPTFPTSKTGETNPAENDAQTISQSATNNAPGESTMVPNLGDGRTPTTTHEEPAPTIPEVDQKPESTSIPTVDGPGTPTGPPQTFETPPPSSIPALSTATSTPSSVQVPVKELIEDSKKRKRRSATPPPSAADIAQKRAKASDGSPRITKSVDTTTEGEDDVTPDFTPDVAGENLPKDTQSEPSGLEQIQASTDAAEVMRERHGLPEGEQSEIVGATSTIPPKDEGDDGQMSKPPPESVQSPGKQSFRTGPPVSLFAGLKKKDSDLPLISPPPKPDQSTLPHDTFEDRTVAPALHPATASLYMRNFKRPLHLPTLRAHVAKIARGHISSSNVDEDPVVTYFLDSIRTHALISFTSTTAASRVRSALHDTRYPDEKTRDPLWIDFVPDDKVQSWIDIETRSGGRGAAQRWEVVYEEALGGIAAVLQEVGAGAGPRRPSTMSQRQPSMSDVQRQPSTSDVQRPSPTGGVHPDRLTLVPQDSADASAVRGDHRRDSQPETSGTGFRALDELFSFTTAKPKLYYKSVSQRVADRRMDAVKDLRVSHADMGRSGDADMKRYSFEIYRGEEEWVDKGPEFGFGRRGASGRGGLTRGGYRGGGSGRGGYRDRDRDDAWRGPRR